MKIPNKFKEYIWLLNTIRKARKISLADINRKWIQTDMSGGEKMARSTFNRHKDAIEDIFGLYIDCDLQDGYKYFIGNESVLHEDSMQNWMLSTLSVNNIISESLSLQARILLQPVPYEGEYLKTVIEAMKKSVRIAVEYRKYGTDVPNHLTFEPYCIKLFKQRWYILGHFHREATAEKPKADHAHAHDRTARESNGEGLVHAGFHGGVGRADIGPGGDLHSEETGQDGAERTQQEAEGGSPVNREADQKKQNRDKNRENSVFRHQKRIRAFRNRGSDLLHPESPRRGL